MVKDRSGGPGAADMASSTGNSTSSAAPDTKVLGPGRHTLRGVAVGLIAPVLTAVIAVLGFREQFIVGGGAVKFGVMLFLWVAIVIGVAVAVVVGRRALAGVIVGLVSVVLVQAVFVLSQATGTSIAVEEITRTWFVSLLMAAFPWAIGMAFGWTVTHRRPVIHDGAPRPLR
ncbi:MAG: hypothetical protein JXP72_10640 [Coriobacteriia bacterium]|nr:hypothetical protein [Coriobacteriia bacterium]